MTAIDDLFRCDYCGSYAPLNAALISFDPGDVTVDSRPIEESGADEPGQQVQLWVPAVHCSPFCGRSATAPTGGSRG